eukprot:jgi/Hompol1/2429/HPOL_002246-RA
MTLDKFSAVTIGGSKFAAKAGRAKTMDVLSDKHAIKLARRIFAALYMHSIQSTDNTTKSLPTSHLNSNPSLTTEPTICVQHFIPFFSDAHIAQEAFDLFDKDGKITMTEEDFKHSLLRIYRERRNLFASLRDLSQALGRLNQILYIFSIILTAFFSLPIYGIPLTAVLPFTTILVAVSFIFGGAAKTTFESIVFLFVMHPYDTGDRVVID